MATGVTTSRSAYGRRVGPAPASVSGTRSLATAFILVQATVVLLTGYRPVTPTTTGPRATGLNLDRVNATDRTTRKVVLS